MRLLSIFLVFLVLGCNTYSEEDINTLDAQIQNYLSEKDITMQRDESGMYFRILEPGAGELIRITDRVVFSYVGRFLDDEVFQVINDHEALEFTVKDLIIGWQEALGLIGNGGEIEIIIPPYLGYGDKQTGIIPPHSILHYQLKVLDVK